MKTLNYFGKMYPDTATLAGIGRYALYALSRTSLKRSGVHGKLALLWSDWSAVRPHLMFLLYSGTRFQPTGMWRVSFGGRDWVQDQWGFVPEDLLEAPLTSITGSGEPIRWLELALYVSFGRYLVEHLEA